MDQHAFVLLDGILNEVEDGFGGCILLVKDNLVFQVEPLESEIHNASAFEIVLDLFASTVNDVSHLVGYYEFLVLQAIITMSKTT